MDEAMREAGQEASVVAIHRRLVEVFGSAFQLELASDGSEVPDIRRAEVAEWDSIAHFRLVMELEEAFGIVLDDAEVVELDSLLAVEAVLLGRGVSVPETAG